MTTPKYKNRYRIPSARATWHDYNGGIYFITVCTAGMQHYFGRINGGKMQYTNIGKHAVTCIKDITNHYPDVEIPLYVVMPNHIHLIVVVSVPCRDAACDVFTTNNAACDVFTMETLAKNKKMQHIANQCGRLSSAIGGIKSAVTRYANSHNILFAWQSRFHDRIIRNQNECNRIATYIENNIAKWEYDEYNT